MCLQLYLSYFNGHYKKAVHAESSFPQQIVDLLFIWEYFYWHGLT